MLDPQYELVQSISRAHAILPFVCSRFRKTIPAKRPAMLRGESWQVDLDPVCGSEANKRRPAVIVSNDRANVTAARLGGGVVTVVPVTSNTDAIFPFQVLLPVRGGLTVDSKAQAEQVRSVSTRRLLRHVGRASAVELAALRLHLAL